jgi:hypothetical protein
MAREKYSVLRELWQRVGEIALHVVFVYAFARSIWYEKIE